MGITKEGVLIFFPTRDLYVPVFFLLLTYFRRENAFRKKKDCDNRERGKKAERQGIKRSQCGMINYRRDKVRRGGWD